MLPKDLRKLALETILHLYFQKFSGLAVDTLANPILAKPNTTTRGKGRLLYMNDGDMLMGLGRALFETQKDTIPDCTNLREGLALLCEDPGRVDAVITDYSMLEL